MLFETSIFEIKTMFIKPKDGPIRKPIKQIGQNLNINKPVSALFPKNFMLFPKSNILSALDEPVLVSMAKFVM